LPVQPVKIFSCLLAAATVALAAETLPDPAQAACKPSGFAVIRFSNGVEGQGQAEKNFGVSFDSANYQGNTFDNALRSAMASWSGVSGSAWRYTFAGYTSAAPASSDGRMTVSRGGMNFPSGVLATTMISAIAATGQIVDSDIFFNPSSNLVTGGSGIDFESVALHEMGHGLGLDHNDGCYSTRTVMQSTIAAGTVARNLQPPEMDGVRYLYAGSGGGSGGGTSVTASPGSLVFNATAGGAAPAPQTISLSGTVGAAWSAGVLAGGGNWLSLSQASGVLPATLAVGVVTGGLPAGFYTARINITAGSATREVSVSLNLTPPAVTTLELGSASVSWLMTAGGVAPAPRTVGVTGTFGLAFTASVLPGAAWLRVAPASASVPANLSISVAPAGLAPQIYTGRIAVMGGGLVREIAVQLEVTAQPRLEVEPAQVSLASSEGSTVPVCAGFRVSAGAATLDWTAASGATWLSVTPVSGRMPATATACATAGNLAPGLYSAGLSIGAAGASSSPQTLAVNFTVTASVAVRDGGVVNAASFAPAQAIAGGELLSIFGANLASQALAASGFPLPAELGDTRVQIGGVAARLIYVSPNQINLVAPAMVAGLAGSNTTLTVFNGRLASPAARVAVARQAPGVFTLLGNGSGAGAVTHNDGSLVTRLSPLSAGEAFSVYLTGLGPLEPSIVDGAAAPLEPLARAQSSVRLLVDGQVAALYYAGAAPGYAGLQVVIAAMPPSLARRFPELIVDVQGSRSAPVTAGGPSLYDVTPATVRAGADATVTIRGLNLSPSSVVSVAGANLPVASVTEGFVQSMAVTIPGRLLASGSLALRVADAQAPAELPSNPVTVRVE